MSLATTLSRLLGYGRDMVSAHLFGAGLVSDAFVVAFRLANFLRDLFAEGALSSAFVPALARARQQGGDKEAWRLASLMVSALAMVLGALVLAGLWGAPWILRLAAPGFSDDPAKFALTLRLTRIVFPFIGFIGFAALFMGMLNARKTFFVPALAPASMNVVMILFGLFVCPHLGASPEQQISGWAWGALCGGAAQCLVQVPSAWRAGFRWHPAWPFKDLGVRRVFRTMVPAVLGQSTTQLNLLVGTMVASQLASGSVTYLYYGNRLMQLPLGVFGVAIAAAVLPDLAAFHTAGDAKGFRRTLSYGLRLTLFTDLPALAGLVCLALPIHVLLLKSGEFDLAAAQATAYASIAYTSGLVFASWIKVLVPAFYALDEPGLVVRVSAVMVLLNLTLNLLLYEPFGYLGLACSTSFVALAQAVTLQVLMTRRTGALWSREELWQVAKMAGVTLAMIMALILSILGLNALSPAWQEGGQGKGLLAAQVLGLVALGAGVYLGLSRWAGLHELIPARFWPRKAKPDAVAREVAKAAETAYDEP